jgi:hypothetical protein
MVFISSITNGSTLTHDGTQGLLMLATAGTNTNTYMTVKGATSQFIVQNASGLMGRLINNSGILYVEGMGANTLALAGQTGNTAATSGTVTSVQVKHTGTSFNPTSGTAVYKAFEVAPAYNQTGTASGAVHGIYYNPTVTSLLGTHYGLYINGGINFLSGQTGINTSTFIGTEKLRVNGEILSTKYTQTQPAAIAAAATTSIDLSTGNVFQINLAATITTLTITNATVGKYYFQFTQDATGSRTIAWPANFKWSGGTAPTLTTTPNKTDYIECLYNGTNFLATAQLNF